MKKFAKLFEDDSGIGQILVFLNTNDDGNPSLKYFFNPGIIGLDTSSLSFDWNDDSEESWEKAEKALESSTEEKVKDIVFKAIKHLKKEFE